MTTTSEAEAMDLEPTRTPADAAAPAKAPAERLVDSRLVASPKLRARIERAAKLAGFASPQELLDATADAGFLPAPPPDGLTESLTLEELGAELGLRLASVPRSTGPDAETSSEDPLASFFAKLTPVQQDALLVHLCHSEQKSHAQIAHALKLSPLRVRKAIALAVERKGDRVIGARLSTVVGQISAMAERTIEGLTGNGDFKAAWTVQKEFTKMLMDLGVVQRTAHRVEVQHEHALREDQRAEIERLVELQRKQERREEEIKRASCEVTTVPALEQP